jgi:ureidoglycolate lyase
MKLIAQPLTAEAFSPFGTVLDVPPQAGRTYFSDTLANRRDGARPSLSLARREDVATLPFTATVMERHEFSSQSFVPIDCGGWIVMVAPHTPDNRPDMTKARAFLAGPEQGVTYGANIWHHPMTIVEQPAVFAIFMWLEGGTGDEEFFTLPQPVTISR